MLIFFIMPKAKILYRSDSEESDCDDNFFNPPEKQDEPAVESLEENTEILPPPVQPNATDAPKKTRKPRTNKAVKTEDEPVAIEPVRENTEGFICPFCYKPYKKKSYLDKHIEQNRCQKKQEMVKEKIKKADEILEKEKIKQEKKTKRQIAKEKKLEKEKRIQQILEEQKAEEEAEQKAEQEALMKQTKKAVVKKQTPKKPVKPRAKKNVDPITEEDIDEPLPKPVLKRTPVIHNSTRFGSYKNRHLIPQNVIINFD